MSLIVFSDAVWRVCDFCLILVPFGHHDEPEILRYAITPIEPSGHISELEEFRLFRQQF